MGYRPGRARLPRDHPHRDEGNDGLTLQNRVLPTGEIIAHPARGTLMGNRGILHDADRRLGTSRWTHHAWVTCLLCFRGRQRRVMAPRRYTELFFLDEATALAAGHRPCGECRRAAYRAFIQCFHRANGTDSLRAVDKALHAARVTRRRAQIRFKARASDLPDGSFVLIADYPHLLHGSKALRYSPAGYTAALPKPAGVLSVLTPAPTITTLAAGYRPTMHESAAAPG